MSYFEARRRVTILFRILIAKESKENNKSANNESGPYAKITDELIKKQTQETDFSKIVVLSFQNKHKHDGKIRVAV